MPYREIVRITSNLCRDRGQGFKPLNDWEIHIPVLRSLYSAMGTFDETFPVSGVRRPVDMILVLVGTNPYSFDRMVRAVDEHARNSGEEIFVQLGNTDYVPQNAQYKRFLEKEEIFKKIEEADLIITQGGFGSIADCLKAGKKIVAVPRKPELKEAPDKQEELVRELERLGRLVGVYEIDTLPEAIKKARLTDFQQSGKQKISSIINTFIQDNI
jgi:UDP-N-acetylglucosamine transferase subunit ALG13